MNTEGESESTQTDQEFLSVKQVAAYLNISAAIVYRFCTPKMLTHYRFGEGAGAIRVKRAELMEFIRQCRVEESGGEVRFVDPPRDPPLVLKHLKLGVEERPLHPCGAMTKAGTPCALMTRQERCHQHREKADDSGKDGNASGNG